MLQTSALQTLVESIIEHQKNIIGPLAIDQAKKVPGLIVVDGNKLRVEVNTPDTQALLIQLVKKYEDLFGLTSVEVCKEAVKESQIPITDKDLPEILR
jgi:hypothetical protein